MTHLADIRDLECRLHSHCLTFPDKHLMTELLFLLDELQVIHAELSGCGIPEQDDSQEPLPLHGRVERLIRGQS